MAKQPVQQIAIDFSTGRNGSAAIIQLLSRGHTRDELVDDDVRGSRIERQDFGRFSTWRDNRDVGDSAEIQRDTTAFMMSKDAVIEKWDERSPGASACDIGRAEVRNDRDSSTCGNNRAFADLQGVFAVFMVNGLAMAADKLNAIEAYSFIPAKLDECGSKSFSKYEIEARDLRRMRVRVGCAQDSTAQLGRVGDSAMGDRLDTTSTDINDGHIDRVNRGPANQSSYAHGFINWSQRRKCVLRYRLLEFA